MSTAWWCQAAACWPLGRGNSWRAPICGSATVWVLMAPFVYVRMHQHRYQCHTGPAACLHIYAGASSPFAQAPLACLCMCAGTSKGVRGPLPHVHSSTTVVRPPICVCMSMGHAGTHFLASSLALWAARLERLGDSDIIYSSEVNAIKRTYILRAIVICEF